MDNELQFYLGEDVADTLDMALGDPEMLGRGVRLKIARKSGKEHESFSLGRASVSEALLRAIFELEGEGELGLQAVVLFAMASELGATADVTRDVRGGLGQSFESVYERVWGLSKEIAVAGDNIEVVAELWPRLKKLREKVGDVDPIETNHQADSYRVSYLLLEHNLRRLGIDLDWFGEHGDEMVGAVDGDEYGYGRTIAVLRRLEDWREQVARLGFGLLDK